MKKICYSSSLLFFLFFVNSFSQFNEYYPEVKWFTIKTEHFSVHFHEGAERTAKVVAKIAEEIYEPITSFYGYKPERVHFVIKDIDDYSNGATYFFDNKIEIWSPPLETDLRGTHHWLRNVIAHEFTHMVQLQAAMKFPRTLPAFYLQVLNYERERRPDVLYGFPNVIVSYPIPGINVPQWFAEGTAQYMRNEFQYDFWDSHRDMILRSYVLDDNMLTWNQMTVFDKTSLGNESVYNSGFALVSYIAMTYGEQKLIEINNQLKNKLAFTIDEAIKKVLNKTGQELYNEWKSFLKNYYTENTKAIKENLFKGDLIEPDGFGNFFPTFSPDGSKIYYLSNKGEDYFLTSLYVYDLKTKNSEKIQSGVSSTFSLFPDGNKILYAKLTEKNKNLVKIHDLYIYDLEKKKEKRLTFGLRANNPALSPDGKTIVFISQKDGTLNLHLIDIEGKNHRQLTFFRNGEQIFNPKFSPDGQKIIFDFSLNESRDIAICDLDGNIDFILNEKNIDERNPIFLSSEEIIYSSDKKGIFNLFVYNLKTKTERQITNVLGGAFYPNVNFKGELVYSGYTSTGYKIFFISDFSLKDFSQIPSYDYHLYKINHSKRLNGNFDWEKLKNFDDTQIPNFEIENYSASFTKLSFIPFLRYDNYSRTAKGIELIKPGLYFYSSDILNRSGMFGSLAINSRFERDIYFGFEYRDRIPLFFELGLKPELNLELFSVSRKAETFLGLMPDTLPDGTINYGYKTPVNITYNLFEVDFSAKHFLFSKSQTIQFRTSYSRYSADLSSFLLPGGILYPATYEVYLKGWTFNLIYNFENIALKKDNDINPYGTKINLNLEYSTNNFNPETYYDENQGQLLTKYGKTKYSRIELNLMQAFKLPSGKHSLTFKTRAGTTLGPQVDNFFDFYLGGLIGMKSYPFYAISGNEIFHLNVNYRFPIWEEIDKRLYHLYIDKVYGSIYFDYGNAWEGKQVKLKNFKKGVGAELRVQMNSFYIFPTSLFVNVAYGFDEFKRQNIFTKEVIKYGKEFLIYFGILFGFEL
ncbi:MAG: biopolymer transporter Tol [Ignavibacteria bacterium]|nr:biopolymer transporter Tol [Ignavibacteria bacterium]